MAAPDPHDTSAHSRLPTVTALAVFAVTTVLAARTALKETAGQWVYALDDAYIHMSFARTLAEHGAWSVHADHFANASSSPLWVGLLAVLRWVGVSTYGPLALAIACGALALATADRMLCRWGVGALSRTAGLTGGALSVPLALQAVAGMEHLAMAAGTLFVLDHGTRREGSTARLLVACALLPLLRLEALFVVGGVATVLIVRGRTTVAIGAAVCAATPVALWGAWSVAQGWFALPNSVVLKSALSSDSSSGLVARLHQRLSTDIIEAPEVLMALLCVGALGLVCKSRRELRYMAQVTVAAGLAHLTFARVGWFGRYESHLVFLSVVATAALADRAWREGGWRRIAGVGAVALLTAGMFERAHNLYAEFPDRVELTWKGHIQMAEVIAALDPASPVATTEAGAITYLAEADLVDLAGLADIEIARLRRAGDFRASPVDTRLQERGAEVAIVYRHFLGPNGIDRLPDSWLPVATWKEEGRHESADLLFFARTTRMANKLAAVMRSREAGLSRTTRQIVHWDPGEPRALPPRVVSGSGGREGEGWALYTNGTLEWATDDCGELAVVLAGASVAGEGPRVMLYAGTDHAREMEVTAAGTEVKLVLFNGEQFRVSFLNDLELPSQGDRNLVVRSATLTPGCQP